MTTANVTMETKGLSLVSERFQPSSEAHKVLIQDIVSVELPADLNTLVAPGDNYVEKAPCFEAHVVNFKQSPYIYGDGTSFKVKKKKKKKLSCITFL